MKLNSTRERLLHLKVDRLLGAAAATVAAATAGGLVATPGTCEAAIVHSGPINIAIPDSFDGVYFNLITGIGSASGGDVPGWDINPYSAGVGTFNLWGADTTTWLVDGTTFIHALGTLVDSTGTFGRPGGPTDVGLQVTLNADNYFGVQFTNEGTGIDNYAWVKIAFGATASDRAITEYAYEDTGAGINVGAITAVPEPSTVGLLAMGAVGLFTVRRRRAAAAANSAA